MFKFQTDLKMAVFASQATQATPVHGPCFYAAAAAAHTAAATAHTAAAAAHTAAATAHHATAAAKRAAAAHTAAATGHCSSSNSTHSASALQGTNCSSRNTQKRHQFAARTRLAAAASRN